MFKPSRFKIQLEPVEPADSLANLVQAARDLQQTRLGNLTVEFLYGNALCCVPPDRKAYLVQHGGKIVPCPDSGPRETRLWDTEEPEPPRKVHPAPKTDEI